jgi:hypothetical protein
MLEGMGRQVLEKLAERLRTVESAAAQQLFEVRELFGPLTHSISLGKHGVPAL